MESVTKTDSTVSQDRDATFRVLSGQLENIHQQLDWIAEALRSRPDADIMATGVYSILLSNLANQVDQFREALMKVMEIEE
jgi:hypothetical protein